MELLRRNKRRVSVLTPVHNTALELLRKAFDSLRNQSFGFAAIQWVVVFHNCSDAYVHSAKRMIQGYPNITCSVVSAEGTGVSYARNATLRLAEGEYIFFLDADDEMLSSCIERVVAEMDRHGADTAIFEAECRMGSSVISHWSDALSNPYDESVVFERGDPRIGKSMCASGMTLWTRCYRRDFLRKEKMTFNEGFFYAEDLLFNIQATGMADKVCVIPELCAYAYNFGVGMTTGLSAEVASGDAGLFLLRMYRYGRACGLDLTNVMWKWAANFIRQCLFSAYPSEVKEAFVHSMRQFVEKLSPPAMERREYQAEMDNDYRLVTEALGLAAGSRND